MIKPIPPLILASGSPRRAELLRQINLDFTVATHDVDETQNVPTEPAACVRELARRKAQSVAINFPNQIVVGADTIVVIDEEILGKPKDPSEARQMLRRLSGRGHQVFSGVALVKNGKTQTVVEKTRVIFRDLSWDEIDWYVRTGEPMDKAGAYGIQGLGAILVDHLEGCYFNVMGFPLTRFYVMLRDFLAENDPLA